MHRAERFKNEVGLACPSLLHLDMGSSASAAQSPTVARGGTQILYWQAQRNTGQWVCNPLLLVTNGANLQKGSISNNMVVGLRNVVWQPEVVKLDFGTYFLAG